MLYSSFFSLLIACFKVPTYCLQFGASKVQIVSPMRWTQIRGILLQDFYLTTPKFNYLFLL